MKIQNFTKISSFVVILSLVLGAFVGCGSSEAPPTAQSTQNTEDGVKTQITKVMNDFLGAIQAGEEEKIFTFFSPKAREVCKEEIVSGLPANDNSKFEVNEIVLLSETEAQVLTTMIDTDHRGNEYHEALGWALKHTEEGWRIVGTAFEVFEGMDSIVIDFENPATIEAAKAKVAQQEEQFTLEVQRAIELERQQKTTPAVTSGQTPAVNK